MARLVIMRRLMGYARQMPRRSASTLPPGCFEYPDAPKGFPTSPIAWNGTTACWPSRKLGWETGVDSMDVDIGPLKLKLQRIMCVETGEPLPWGAEATGVALSDEAALSDDFHTALADCIHRFQLILFRRQKLTPAQHVEVAYRLAPKLGAKLPLCSAADNGFKFEDLVPGCPEIAVLGSKAFDDPDNYYGKPVNNSVKGIQWPEFGACSWHCDGAAFETPGTFTFVHMPVAPAKGQGGATLYASGYEIYDALPEELRAAADAAVIRYVEDGAWLWPYDMKSNGMRRLNQPGELETEWHHEHNLVAVHPVTGRRAVWTAPANVQGLRPGCDEGNMAAQELVEACLSAGIRRTFAHFYDDGDVVISDDRCMLHSTTPFGPLAGSRILHRCGTELRSSRNRHKSFQYLYNVPGSNHGGKMSFKPGQVVTHSA